MSAEQLLEEARRAWRERENAEAQIVRLQRYARATKSMREDIARWSRIAYEAGETLKRILGAKP